MKIQRKSKRAISALMGLMMLGGVGATVAAHADGKAKNEPAQTQSVATEANQVAPEVQKMILEYQQLQQQLMVLQQQAMQDVKIQKQLDSFRKAMEDKMIELDSGAKQKLERMHQLEKDLQKVMGQPQQQADG